jgi:hypothetical protein
VILLAFITLFIESQLPSQDGCRYRRIVFVWWLQNNRRGAETNRMKKVYRILVHAESEIPQFLFREEVFFFGNSGNFYSGECLLFPNKKGFFLCLRLESLGENGD